MKLEKKYGLFTAIAMVVGVVIGSGVFFKAQTVLEKTEGNVVLGILSWVIGGIIMILCACTFAVMATKYEKVNGIVDYAESIVGKKYSYYMGWFVATIYTPAMTGVLGWVSARYFGELFGWSLTSANVMVIGGFFLAASYALNALSPKIAGKFQVSTTVIKLIPLALLAVVGTIYGLINNGVKYSVVNGEVIKEGANQMQILIENFKNSTSSGFGLLLAGVVSTVFAYEGWILATSINAELKDAKKTLPLALFFGCLAIMVIYLLYYIGVLGGATTDVLIVGGSRFAFLQVFGDFFGTILTVFIVISCLGTLNGLMLSCTRSFYALAANKKGVKPEVLGEVDEKTNMPNNSAIVGFLFAFIWFVYFYGANLTETWFGKFSFDSSELPIVTIYAMYLPIFIMFIAKEHKSLGVVKGIVLPILAILGSLFMVYAAIYSHKMAVVYYLIIYLVVMVIGALVLHFNQKHETIEVEK